MPDWIILLTVHSQTHPSDYIAPDAVCTPDITNMTVLLKLSLVSTTLHYNFPISQIWSILFSLSNFFVILFKKSAVEIFLEL